MVSNSLFFLSGFCSSSWRQLTIPKQHLSTGTANGPVASILFFALNTVPEINLNLLKYSFFNFSFSFLCSMSWLCSMPKYVYASVESRSIMSFSNMLPTYILLWTPPFFKHILAHFHNPLLLLLFITYMQGICYLKQTTFPGYIVLQLSCGYNLWYM